jgi:5-formyltetrahydrofolate cyclo-ligase
VSAAAEDEMKGSKAELRRAMRARRTALPAGEVARASTIICAHTRDLLERSRQVALYAAIENEVDLAPLHCALRARGVMLAYPRVTAAGQLSFQRTDDVAELRVTGRLRIPEPPRDAPTIPIADLDALVIPGLAFDRQGHRLGWGAGFYDAVLPRTRALRIGVGFAFQLVANCPAGPNDEKLDIIVTETEIIRVADANMETE